MTSGKKKDIMCQIVCTWNRHERLGEEKKISFGWKLFHGKIDDLLKVRYICIHDQQ